jgi:hypothetical protein
MGIMKVNAADTTTSRLIPINNFQPPPRFWGQLIASGLSTRRLNLFCADPLWMQNIFRASGRRPQSIHTVVVATESEADLTVVLDTANSTVVFDISANPKYAQEEPIARLMGRRIDGSLAESDVVGIVDVIESAAHFYYHLRRQAPPSIAGGEIDIQLHALVGPDGARRPDGPNLLADAGSNKSFVPDPTRLMGMTLINKSSRDWYPSVFYFNPSNFTICA